MDLHLITELLSPFMAPITPNIHSVSCGGMSRDKPPYNDLSPNEPGATGSRDRQEPATLSNEQLTSISTYIDLLIRWNSRINLTAIRDPEQIVTRHFGESLYAARHQFPNVQASRKPVSTATSHVAPGLRRGDPDHATETSDHHLLDIGSGAGFPALPIKIWAPEIHATLVESNQNKTTFLREILRVLTLTNVNVINSRAEDVPAATADTVTFRAVERFQSILPIAIRLIRPGGRAALLVGESQLQSAKTASAIQWDDPISIPQSSYRILLVGTIARVL
jgi:16S rRNA (guanine527-N7)-methyltransferase